MGLKDLVVLLDGSPLDAMKLAVSAELARRNDAHLTGLSALQLLLPVDMAFALGGYPDLSAMPDVANRMEQQAQAKAASIEADFRDLLRREGLTGDWEYETGPMTMTVTQRAQTADLLVVGQVDPDNPPPVAARTLIEDVLMTAGRPLLIVPYAGRFDTIGTNVLVGWTHTRESTRAVHDALPVFAPAAKVTVLAVESSGSVSDTKTVPTADIAEHLARHGLVVSAARTVASDGVSIADALLDHASDIGADLLVIGGYGHSRAREIILGGVTRDLLQHMTVPVLMSH